jgi:hypothetical protein
MCYSPRSDNSIPRNGYLLGHVTVWPCSTRVIPQKTFGIVTAVKTYQKMASRALHNSERNFDMRLSVVKCLRVTLAAAWRALEETVPDIALVCSPFDVLCNFSSPCSVVE